MQVTIIAACTKTRIIGANGIIPWNIPEELAHFKKTTTGKAVVFGRKTFDGIAKALPDRFNVVVSKSGGTKNAKSTEGVHFATSLHSAIELCKNAGFSEIFICGGEQLYRAALSEKICSKIILSVVSESVCKDVAGADAFFPEINPEEWKLCETTEHEKFTVFVYERIF